jgi:hypothetical protein
MFTRFINSPLRPGAPGGGMRTFVVPSDKTATKNFDDTNAKVLSPPKNPDAATVR